jgi:hypothetical protein
MVLLDRNLQQPLNTADTITMDEATKGMVAVYTKDINRLLHTIQSLTKFIDDKKIDEEKVIDLQVGNSKCIVKTEKNGAVNSYNIVLTTDTGNLKRPLCWFLTKQVKELYNALQCSSIIYETTFR